VAIEALYTMTMRTGSKKGVTVFAVGITHPTTAIWKPSEGSEEEE